MGPERAEQGFRRQGRELALRALYALDTRKGPSDDPVQAAEEALARCVESFEGLDEGRAYARELVRGVASELEALDTSLRAALQKWRLERLARVDRGLLRIGCWELLHGVPVEVCIDEAVELAKSYGTEDSGGFVNGVLDRVARDAGKPRWTSGS
jgi:N utilization substance protein B